MRQTQSLTHMEKSGFFAIGGALCAGGVTGCMALLHLSGFVEFYRLSLVCSAFAWLGCAGGIWGMRQIETSRVGRAGLLLALIGAFLCGAPSFIEIARSMLSGVGAFPALPFAPLLSLSGAGMLLLGLFGGGAPLLRERGCRVWGVVLLALAAVVGIVPFAVHRLFVALWQPMQTYALPSLLGQSAIALPTLLLLALLGHHLITYAHQRESC